MNAELLPCPFCGSANVSKSIGWTGNNQPFDYIECEDCAGNAEPEHWNRRAFPQSAKPEAQRQAGQEPAGETYSDLWNALQRIDTAAAAMPTFKVTHDGGLQAVTQNIIDAMLAVAPPPAAVQPGWISVDDWNPEPGSIVLAACKGYRGTDYVVAAYYSESERGWWEANTDPTANTDGRCYPTHLRPMIQPPPIAQAVQPS